jgi:hypothetical protein
MMNPPSQDNKASKNQDVSEDSKGEAASLGGSGSSEIKEGDEGDPSI